MPQFTLLYGARQLLTLRGSEGPRRGSELHDLGVIENGSVLIENGLIRAIGATRRIENLKESRGALEIDVTGSIVMPGLIDAGCHVTYSSSQNEGSSRARRPGNVYADGMELMRACLRHGTVSAMMMASAETADFKSDVAVLRQLTKMGTNPVHAIRVWDLERAPANDAERQEYLVTAAMLSRRRLLDCVQIPSSMLAGGEARKLLPPGIPVALKWTGGDVPLQALLRDVHPRSVLCGNTLSPEDLTALAEWGGVCVFIPSLRAGTDPCSDLRRAADAGCAVALASGYHPLNSPAYSMQMGISLAVVNGNLTPEEAIAAATVNSAWAAGRGNSVGTLERGRVADILVMSVSDYRDITRQFGINNATTVLRQGEVVFNRGSWKRGAHGFGSGEVRSQRL